MKISKRLLLMIYIASLILTTAPLVRAQGFSETGDITRSPNEVLRSAKTILIRSDSSFFKASTLENSLLEREEFQEWDIAIVRDLREADLVIDVGRKMFTTSFIFSVIDPKTDRVVASGRVNSIGGTVEHKISDSLIKRIRIARLAQSQTTNKKPD